MSDFSSLISGLSGLSAKMASVAAPSPAELAKRAQIADTARNFESSFLSTMMQSMFKDVNAGEFSGGQGEEAFKSFFTEAIAKQVAKAGGVGISGQIEREMLKLQGLTE